MTKKALLSFMTGVAFLGAVEANEIPANFDNLKKSDKNEIPYKEDDDTMNVEKLVLKNFAGFQQKIDTTLQKPKNGNPPEGFRLKILDEDNSDNSNSLDENFKLFEKGEKQTARLNSLIRYHESLMNGLENLKLELAREILEKKGKIDAGNDKDFEKYRKENPKKFRKILANIENQGRFKEAIKDNEVEDYSIIKETLNQEKHLREIVIKINELFNIKNTVSSLTIKDALPDSKFSKKFNELSIAIFNSNFSKKFKNKEIKNQKLFLDLEKGYEKIKAANNTLEIIKKLEGLDIISSDEYKQITTAINFLEYARSLGVGGVNDIPVTDSSKFKEELYKLIEFAGLVALDENRQTFKDFSDLLIKNGYPEAFDINNLDDDLEKIPLEIVIDELKKVLIKIQEYTDIETKITISEKEINEIEKITLRYNQLKEIKMFKDNYKSLSSDEKVEQHEKFSQFLFAIIDTYYQDEDGNINTLKIDLESLKKSFWRMVYKYQNKQRFSTSYSGTKKFAEIVNIHKDGSIDIIEKGDN